jgi:LmbE family N-acetylglucosaminyl deacetylase
MSATAAAAMLAALAERRPIGARVVIVVAHPDDETIGMGAQLKRFRNALLVQITNGAPRDGQDAIARGYATVADYAAGRRAELAAALVIGEAQHVSTEFIGIPDQEVHGHLVAITQWIAECLREDNPAAVFVQPYEGGHPDHDAAAFAVHLARRRIAAEGTPPPIIEMTGYHARGDGWTTGTFLPAMTRAATLRLSPAERLRKRRMLDCYASQTDRLARFGIEVERFRDAPEYDFTRPPHAGELHYERLGWNITGELWRHHARAALGALGLGS